MKQNQKVKKNGEAYQAGRDIVINQGTTLSEIETIVKKLLELHTPQIVSLANETAEKRLKEFIEIFLSPLVDEMVANKIQASLKEPRSQILLKEGMESAIKYGDYCDLELLVAAIQKAMLEDNTNKAMIASSASSIIPQLNKSQLALISILFFVTMFGVPEESFTLPPIVQLERFAKMIILEPESDDIDMASKFHLITLGVCSHHQLASSSAEDYLKLRYPKTFEKKIIPLLSGELEEPRLLKGAIKYFNNNGLGKFIITPVGTAIGFLIAKMNGAILGDNLFGQY